MEDLAAEMFLAFFHVVASNQIFPLVINFCKGIYFFKLQNKTAVFLHIHSQKN